LVDTVLNNSPADTAGLKVNDILLSINGVEVESAAKTLDMIAETQPGSEIELIVSRDDKTISMKVVVGELIPQMIARG